MNHKVDIGGDNTDAQTMHLWHTSSLADISIK